MPLLVSFESLPYSCSEVLKCLHTALARTSKTAFITAGPVESTPAPRPFPAPGDPYHELHAVLQRIIGVRLAVHRHPNCDVVCVLDGWVPSMAFPHRVLHDLCLAIQSATLNPIGITGHEMVYFRGCHHESFERVLCCSGDNDSGGPSMTLAHVIATRARLDAVARGEVTAGPFRLLSCHVVGLPPFCEDNLIASSNVARRALTTLFSPQKWITGSL
jgi:hypothetical protein